MMIRHYILATVVAALLMAADAAKAENSASTEGETVDTLVVRDLRGHGITFSHDNSVVLFNNGQAKFDDLFQAIRQAKSSVHLEYFNFRNDSITAELVRLLARKVREGVEVRALFDAFGNTSNNRPLKNKHLRQIREQGIEIYEFDPLHFPWINHVFHRDHRKIVVIDGQIAYTGGMNVADYYITGKPEFGEWHDIHCRVEGDVVGDLQKIFINFWNKVTGQDVKGAEYYPGERDARAHFSNLSPDDDTSSGNKLIGVVNRDPATTPRIIHDTFVHAITHAQKQILIINPYFTICRHIRKALRKAAARGVDVQIMVSAKSDIPITPRIVEYTVHKLMKSGAKIWFFEGGFHHSKIMMIDGLYSFLGSANLNSRSLSFDYECNLLVADTCTTERLNRLFMSDRDTRCFQLTPERWKEWGRWKKFKGWLFHFLTPFVLKDRDDFSPDDEEEFTDYFNLPTPNEHA